MESSSRSEPRLILFLTTKAASDPALKTSLRPESTFHIIRATQRLREY
jgi:hypothetical protein